MSRVLRIQDNVIYASRCFPERQETLTGVCRMSLLAGSTVIPHGPAVIPYNPSRAVAPAPFRGSNPAEEAARERKCTFGGSRADTCHPQRGRSGATNGSRPTDTKVGTNYGQPAVWCGRSPFQKLDGHPIGISPRGKTATGSKTPVCQWARSYLSGGLDGRFPGSRESGLGRMASGRSLSSPYTQGPQPRPPYQARG